MNQRRGTEEVRGVEGHMEVLTDNV